MITVIVMLMLLLLIIWKKRSIKKLVSKKRFITGFLIVYLLLEIFYWSLIWGYRIEPLYERFPLHLCGSVGISGIPIVIFFFQRPP